MSNVKYDPVVIQTFANAMYAKAQKIIISETIKYGFFIGFGVMVASLLVFTKIDIEVGAGNTGLMFLIGSCIGGYIGWQNGQLKAFHLKLEAQRALCFVQMEQNTKSTQTLTKVA